MQDSSNYVPIQWANLQGDLLAFFSSPHYIQPSLLVSCVASYLWTNSHLVGLGNTSLSIQTLFHSVVHFFSWCVQTLEKKPSAWRSKFSVSEMAFCAPMYILLQSLQIGCAVCTGSCCAGFWYHFQHSDVCEVWEAFRCSVSSSSGFIVVL